MLSSARLLSPQAVRRSAMYFSANHAVRTEATAVLDERATLWGTHTFNEDSHLASSTFVRRTPTLALSGPHLHCLAHTLKLMMQCGLVVLKSILIRQSADIYITAWPVHSLPTCVFCLRAHLLCCRLCNTLRCKRGCPPFHLCVASCALGIALSGLCFTHDGRGACLRGYCAQPQ